jgi:hypothetical protein
MFVDQWSNLTYTLTAPNTRTRLTLCSTTRGSQPLPDSGTTFTPCCQLAGRKARELPVKNPL